MRGLAPPAEAPTAPRRRRFAHPGWTVASVVLVVLLVAAGIFVAVTGGGAPPTPGAAPSSTSRAPAATSAPEEAAGCAGLPSTDQSLPRTPPEATWHGVGRVAVPVRADVGPAHPNVPDPCYAHTPTGALFAAANFLGWSTSAEQLQAAIGGLTAPGPGRDRLLELARTDPVAITGSGAPYAIAGYTFLSSSPDTVAVSLAVRAGSGGLAAVPVTVVWDGGWLVDLPADGNLTRLASPAQTLAGFTPWKAP